MFYDMHERLREVRTHRKLTQAEVAREVGLSRLTYINMESGEKSPTLDQIARICEVLKASVHELLFPGETLKRSEVTNATPSLTKYRQMCLACIRYGSDDSNGWIQKSKLTRLLYLIDFSWYRDAGQSMSGQAYYHWPHGPFTGNVHRMLDHMFDAGVIMIELRGTALFISATDSGTQGELSDSELEHIRLVSHKWRYADTLTLSEFVYSQTPWAGTQLDDEIPFDAVGRLSDRD